jgi:hypothetical protein
MKDRPKRLSVADQIRKGLEEAIRHARGEITLKTTTLEWPDPPPEACPTGGRVMATSRGPFRPGEAAPRSGQYLEVGPRGGRGREVTPGRPAPPPASSGSNYGHSVRPSTRRRGRRPPFA